MYVCDVWLLFEWYHIQIFANTAKDYTRTFYVNANSAQGDELKNKGREILLQVYTLFNLVH